MRCAESWRRWKFRAWFYRVVLKNDRFLVLENDRFLVLENDRRPIDDHILVLWWRTFKWEPADALTQLLETGSNRLIVTMWPYWPLAFLWPIHTCLPGFLGWCDHSQRLSLSPPRGVAGLRHMCSPLHSEQWVASAWHSKIPGSEKSGAAWGFHGTWISHFWSRMWSQVISH